MDEKLLIALVAAVSALIGSAIPTLFNYWNNNKQREFEVKKALLEKQRQIYSDLMLCLQQMINTNKKRGIHLSAVIPSGCGQTVHSF